MISNKVIGVRNDFTSICSVIDFNYNVTLQMQQCEKYKVFCERILCKPGFTEIEGVWIEDVDMEPLNLSEFKEGTSSMHQYYWPPLSEEDSGDIEEAPMMIDRDKWPHDCVCGAPCYISVTQQYSECSSCDNPRPKVEK